MNSPRLWSLASVIPTLLLLVFLVLQTAFIFLDYQTKSERLLLQSREEVLGKVNKLQQSLSDALMRHDNAVAERELTLAALNDNVSQLLVLDENAEVLLSNQMSLKFMFASAVLPEFEWADFYQARDKNRLLYQYVEAEKNIYVYAPLQLARKDHSLKRNNTGAIFVSYSLVKPYQTLLANTIQDSMKNTLVVAIALLTLTILLVKMIIAPLNRLVQAAQQLNNDNDDAFPQLKEGQGEIGLLQRAFMAMADKMKLNFEQLSASEQRWHYALSGARDGVWDWSIESNQVFFSARWKEMLGYIEDEIGDDIEELEQRIHPDDLMDMFACLRLHLAGKTPFYEHIHRVQCKDGDFCWVLDRGKVIEWAEDGKPSRLICTHTDITEYRKAQDLVAFQAYHDEVTQLPNRRKLLEHLAIEISRTKQSQQWGCLLFIDLDKFKQVNDVHGHVAADTLLRMVAKRLLQMMEGGNIVARLLGDEFAIVLPQLGDEPDRVAEQALGFAQAVRKRIASPFVLQGQRINLSCTIGITLFPDGEQSATDILRQADIAMFHGKEDGRDMIHFFSEEMENRVQRNHNLQQMLRLALEQDEIKLFLQPKVDRKGNVMGCEALLRWYQPQRGWITPSEFVPAAEDSGLIIELGNWVLTQSCLMLKHWQQSGLPEQFKTLSVNVSPKQFLQVDFIEQISRIVKESEINPNLLELEITETILVSQLDDAVEKIKALRALGIRFAIDDFGTGYSSMSYLSTLPITALKIDRSFVEHLETQVSQQAIVAAIIAMAENLGLEVIAEGVENVAQLNFLKAKGCALFQGYLFGRALSAEEFSQNLLPKAAPQFSTVDA
ncbi:EAL domain-containing protein [Motilimonas sp. 1_MG-2023]|uniref:putative bifunctional diguanylate cyclase/phosphodiesterase n=1 Tax=Motilimonas sp. 1_MG-2023 TaxID=3062672 RepID=UPI0026E449F2|nr:EAL domain-containing protein [Motilimonas sp. 1_MG-2023]MDO6526556.1 EAL domain-containing protein [Motilimonas sp. 1_MG-2023]